MLELKIATRYLLSRRKEVFLLISTLISIAGITIGVGALLVTLSVMNGFHKDLMEKFLSTTSAINVLLPKTYSKDQWQRIIKDIEKIKGVSGASPYVLNQAVFTKRSRSQGVAVKGIVPQLETKATRIKKQIILGKYRLNKGEIFIGSELARMYGLGVGDRVFLTIPPSEFDFTGGRVKEFRISGIFRAGMWEYDMNLVYINLNEMQKLYSMQDAITGIEVNVSNIDEVNKIAAKISELVPYLWVRTWRQTNRTLFSALELEKKTMFVILSLIVLVAVFNIISSLLLQTIEKVRDIGVLRALGASRKFIEKIFAYQGLISGVTGIILGNIFAVLLCFLLKKYQFIKIPADVYYLSALPVIVEIKDFIVVDVVSLLLAFLASFIPARIAGKLDPSRILRYE